MTYFLKDCERKVSPPAKERADIVRAVAETFATRPYIRFVVLIEPYADGSGDDTVELIAIADKRFNVPLIPWAATSAFGGKDDPTATLSDILARAIGCGVLHRRDWMEAASERLEAWISAAEGGADISVGDALEAACLANRFADELIETRRPAFRIEARRLPQETSDR